MLLHWPSDAVFLRFGAHGPNGHSAPMLRKTTPADSVQRIPKRPLSNGDLLSAAERAGFEVMLTADQRIRYQQNLTGRRLALIVLSSPAWPVVKDHMPAIKAAVDAATPGSYQEVHLPRPGLRRRPRGPQLKL